jgi:hypothetical protein
MKLDSLQDVKDDPRFQALVARADTHLSIHRPKHYAELKSSGKLKSYLESNALVILVANFDNFSTAFVPYCNSGTSLSGYGSISRDLLLPSALWLR